MPGALRTAAERVNSSEAAAAWCGIVLAIAVFFDWYGVTVLGPVGQHGARGVTYGGKVNGWNSLQGVRIALVAVAVLAIAHVLLRGLERIPESPSGGLLISAAGAVACVLIVWRLVSPPIAQIALPGSFKLQVSLRIGGFVALIAAIALAVAAWRGAQQRMRTAVPRA